MGSDHSSLALVHNIPELEEAIKHRRTDGVDTSSHGWDSTDIPGDLTISEDCKKITRNRGGNKKYGVRGLTAYEYGVHFFEFTWSKEKSENICIGITTKETELETDGDILLGSDDQSVGWNLATKEIYYNGCPIKLYPEKISPSYNVPKKVVMILNMDQGSLSFKADDKHLGVAMSGLRHVAGQLFIAASLAQAGDEVTVKYLGGSDTVDEFDLPTNDSFTESDHIDSSSPLQFHEICSTNIVLENNYMKARRNKPKKTYNSATVLTNRPLNDGEEMKIKLKEIDNSNWNGLFVLGVTNNVPESLSFPADSMVDCENGHTWAFRMDKVLHNGKEVKEFSSDLDNLQVNDVVTIAKNGAQVRITVNGKSDTINLTSDIDMYGFVDVYGQATAVELKPGKTGTLKRKSTKADKPPKSRKQYLSSMEELFITLKKKDVTDIPLVAESLKVFSGAKLDQSRKKRRMAGDELTKKDRPKTIKEYLQFLIEQKDEQTSVCIIMLLSIITNYTDVSLSFCKRLGEVGTLDVTMKLLKHTTVMKDNEEYLEIILTFLYNCSRASENKARFRRMGYVRFAKKFLDTDKFDKNIMTVVYFTMSYIFVKDEVSILKLDSNVLTHIISCLKLAANSHDQIHDGWHIRELMIAMNNLTANSSNISAFVKHSAVEALMQVFNTDAVYDKECALNAIWNLTTEDTKMAIASTDTLIERLELLKECGHATVEQAAKRILAKIKVSQYGQMMPTKPGEEKCKYKSLCERFKASLNINDAYFDKQYDMCYCDNCHADRGDNSIYTRGQPPKDYGIPVGWCRFGLRPSPRAEALGVFNKWHRAFHGTRKESVESILKVGELAPAGRAILGGEKIKELPGHFSDEGYKPEGFNTKRIFLSPSIRYSGVDTYASPSRFKDPLTGKSQNAKVAFQVLVEPDSYEVCPETIGADHEIDPGFSNQEMEWIVEVQGGTLLYGLLVKVNTTF